MKFYNINWTTKHSKGSTSRIQPATLSGLPTEMDVACDCGNRWHATRGSEEGQIARGVHGEVTCPACGTVDTYRVKLPLTA